MVRDEETDPQERPERAPTDSSALNAIVERCLERFESEGSAAVEDECAKHPAHADAIRRRLEGLARLGLLESSGSEAERQLPERLGEYRLVRRLASGGMGVVYVAEHEPDGRRVALKLQRPDQLLLGRAAPRFQREIDTILRLDHPGIVPIHAVGQTQGIPWFAMELVPGASLADVVERLRGRSPAELRGGDVAAAIARHLETTELAPSDTEPAELFEGGYVETCLRIVAQVAETLAHAHGRGIVHRDVKPSNVMVTLDGRVVLVDFGLAMQEEASRLTRTGAQLGSLPYLAPERVRGDESTDARRGEVYSLGVTLYELLCLRAPFVGRHRATVERSILHGAFERPSRWNGAIPWDVETVCLAAMERHPNHRYASAEAFAGDLRNALALQGIAARRPGWLRRMRLRAERHPGRAVAALALALALLVGPLLYAEVQRRAAADVRRANDALQRANERARSHLEDLVRLSDVRALDELEREADELWPARPSTVPAMDAWLERARDVLAHLPAHEAALSRLEGGSTEEDGFAHGDRTYWLDTLRGLVERLHGFRDPAQGRVARIAARRERAATLPQRSTEGHAEAWSAARAAIREHPRYAGLDLTPQVGLVPLGPDPQSGLWEFWHVDSGARPERDPATGRVRIEPDAGIVLVLIPGGTFSMGAQSSDPEEANHDPQADMGDESPVHEVTLAPFFLARHELTQGQWQRTMGANPSYYTVRSRFVDDVRALVHPVEQISWLMARDALRRLDLELPTEAQWEYACRAGTRSVYFTGDLPETLQGFANLSDEGSKESFVPGWSYEAEFADGFVAHAPVGSFEPNPFGLHDVHGNVWEWVRDPYAPYGAPARAGDGLRDATGRRATYRVVRGGSFSRPAASARSADRDAYAPDARDFYLGVRASRAVESGEG